MNSTTKINILRTIVAVFIALLISFVIIFFTSKEPVEAIIALIIGPLQRASFMGNVIESMIPLIFTGVGVCIMFTANQINLAGEGAFHIGGLVSATIALNMALPAGIHPIVCIFFAGFAGSIVTFIPALLKIKTSANELVSSLMINYIVLFSTTLVLMQFLRDPQTGSGSYPLPITSELTPLIEGTRIHFGIIIALAVSFLAYLFIYKTRIGYELRLTGENESFAKYSGINIVRVVLISQLLGGFVAGMGGGIEIISPIYTRFTWTALLGYGWDAIIVCTLAKKNPLYVPLSAFFLAYLRTGSTVMSMTTDVDAQIITVVQGVIILLIVAEQFLSKFKYRMIEKEAKATLNDGGAK